WRICKMVIRLRVSIIYLRTILRLPGSTLFPYTTLFRSSAVFQKDYKKGTPIRNSKYPLKSTESILSWPYSFQFRKSFELKENQLDRKSTRLNSSHVKISYAVFCLKKKKVINL